MQAEPITVQSQSNQIENPIRSMLIDTVLMAQSAYWVLDKTVESVETCNFGIVNKTKYLLSKILIRKANRIYGKRFKHTHELHTTIVN